MRKKTSNYRIRRHNILRSAHLDAVAEPADVRHVGALLERRHHLGRAEGAVRLHLLELGQHLLTSTRLWKIGRRSILAGLRAISCSCRGWLVTLLLPLALEIFQATEVQLWGYSTERYID